MALENGVTVLNSPGTIDSNYRGEIGVILINHGRKPFVVEEGMRIAQMVITPVLRADIRASRRLNKSKRNKRGFGSTGR